MTKKEKRKNVSEKFSTILDLLQVYESEVRARHKGGMAKDMEDLVKTFGETSASKTASAHAVFGTPYTPFGARKVAKVKTPKLTKAKPTKTPKKTTKGVKPPKTLKKAKVVPKAAKSLVGVKKAKKAAAKTSVKKIKGKSKKTVQRKRTVLKKVIKFCACFSHFRFLSKLLNK